MKAEFHLRLTNTSEQSLSFVIEPWGDFYQMPSGATFEVVFEADGARGQSAPEVVWSANAVTLYAAKQGNLAVFHNGEELGAGRWPRGYAPAELETRQAA